MKAFHTLLAATICATLLTACNQAQNTANTNADAKPAETAATDAKPAETATTTTGESPTVKMYANTMKMTTYAIIQGEHPNLTEEQKTCLIGDGADATYLEPTRAELTEIIGADGIKESDKFYDTEVGKKTLVYIDQQLKTAAGQTFEGEPVTITKEDEQEAAKFTANNPAIKDLEDKMTAKASDPQAMMAKIQDFATKEKARCNIS